MPNLKRSGTAYKVTGDYDMDDYVLRAEYDQTGVIDTEAEDIDLSHEDLKDAYQRGQYNMGGNMYDSLGRASVGHNYFRSYYNDIDMAVQQQRSTYNDALLQTVQKIRTSFDSFAQYADAAVSEAESKLAAAQRDTNNLKIENEQLKNENTELRNDIAAKEEKTKVLQSALDKAAPELKKAAAMDKIMAVYADDPSKAMEMLGEYIKSEDIQKSDNGYDKTDGQVYQTDNKQTTVQHEDAVRENFSVVIAKEADIFDRAATKFEEDTYGAITQGDMNKAVKDHIDRLNEIAAKSGDVNLMYDVDAENKAYLNEHKKAADTIAHKVSDEFNEFRDVAATRLGDIAQQREDLAVELNEMSVQKEELSKENDALKDKFKIVEYMNESTLREAHDLIDYGRKGYTDEEVQKRSETFTNIMNVYRTDPQAAINMLHDQVYNDDLQQQNNEPVYDSSASYEDSSVSYEADIAVPTSEPTSESAAEQKPDHDTSNLEQGTTTVSSDRIAKLNALSASTIYSNNRYDSNPNPDDEFGG